jgi:hypothetical protein
VITEEGRAGLANASTFAGLQSRATEIKVSLLGFLLSAREGGKSVVGYGAAAKGNTLLNYAGVRADLLPLVADAAPSKQGKFLPASHIPVVSPKELRRNRPDFVLILPWNLRHEIASELVDIVSRDTRLVTAMPRFVVHE